MHFESPYMFLLLLAVPVLIGIKSIRCKPGSIQFSTVLNASKSGKSIRQKFLWVPVFLRVLAIILLIIALARPQTGRKEIKDVSDGVAIEMVIDRSSSMGAELDYEGERLNRLEVVKRVFEAFVMGGKHDLEGRPNDLIGMVVFARFPDTICPLTLTHGVLPAFLKSVKLVQTEEENGTAIGDAIALAAARLKNTEDSLREQKDGTAGYEIKSKIIILLSDGKNNYGKRTPSQAAERAKEWGVKIYSIAFGGSDAESSFQTPYGTYEIPSEQRVDAKTLKTVAEKTGGFFREADDAESLFDIYREIDAMEKSAIESTRFVDYEEFFLWFALSGFILVIFEVIFRNTLFRRIP